MTRLATALTASNIDFSYGEKKILHSTSIEVLPGQVVGLLGPNGTGKSTLLGVLSGDLDATSGSVELFGRPLTSYGRKELAQTRSVMPQASEFPFAYLVRDIVAMGRSCWSGSDNEDRTIIEDAMSSTDVWDMADRDVTRLSGGEKARVTLARVIAQKARLVFLDEPTAALDISHQERTMEMCGQMADEGCAVVAVMHDIQLAAAYCDAIALMSGGRIVAYGKPREVLTTEALSEVYGWPISVMELATGDLAIIPGRTARSARSSAEKRG